MNESETRGLLQARGVGVIDKTWQKHQPVLYILEEWTRHYGWFKDLPPDQIPSVARVASPTAIDFENGVASEKMPGRIAHALENEGGRVDYYAIDREIKKPTLVRTTYPMRNEEGYRFYVKLENLFETDDEFFPPGPEDESADWGGRTNKNEQK